mmetsp:Transcript_9057/g.16600  ORF Transcript_9057/g.16600 Transcript_9057/m.16600 type:complete len:343 (+) Transcript_9057:294-1322(+)
MVAKGGIDTGVVTLLNIVSIFCAAMLGWFELWIIYKRKDEMKDRSGMVPQRVRRIIAYCMAIGAHVTILLGYGYSYDASNYPEVMCKAQAVMYTFFLTGFGAAVMVIGVYKLERQVDPLSTNPHPLMFYVIITFVWALIPTIVTGIGIYTEGTWTGGSICGSAAEWAYITYTEVVVATFVFASAINIIGLSIAVCRPLRGTRTLTRCQRFKLTQQWLRFTLCMLLITILLAIAWTLEEFQRNSSGEKVAGNIESNTNTALQIEDYAVSILGLIMLFASDYSFFHFIRWKICKNEDDPPFYILPKYMHRYRMTHPSSRNSGLAGSRNSGLATRSSGPSSYVYI